MTGRRNWLSEVNARLRPSAVCVQTWGEVRRMENSTQAKHLLKAEAVRLYHER